MTDSDSGVNRRKFVQQVAAAGAIGFAATGSVAGKPVAEDVSEAYADPVQFEDALDAHGSDLLAALADEGLLDRGDVGEVPTRRPEGFAAVAQNDEGTAFLSWGGEKPDQMLAVKHVDGGVLSVTVEPSAGRAYARFDAAGDGGARVFDADGSSFDVDTQSCWQTECECLKMTCDGTRSEHCRYCCDPCPTKSGVGTTSCCYDHYNCDCDGVCSCA